MFMSLVPVAASFVAAVLWLKNQTKLPTLAAVPVALAFIAAIASAALFLPGLLPLGNQNYGVGSVVVNSALTLAVVVASVILRAP